ncbi:ABC transporter ATP-binding protein [Geodermatophilus sabuli]|uniref:ABC-type quaternary amine transporter n=1 Tax=Geodermatophilus sabuli TaxID=1564158 RepID=A0A285EB20_9ACTN|nr:ABC transporter ATP-binding protein [Geodermatophilus sabuli]MBB3085337.1 iron(III) transport system ATP-binding protein [Geodermatophilus sabuli]SNX96235.1 iron(III) transport system ATP-binding protein [Geodermatophilus sabuli]
MSALTVTCVTKSYGSTPVLTGVDLRVPEGGLTALLGPSGCGKTTLLRLIAGFDDPDTGTIELDGRLVAGPDRSVAAHRRHIGFVPQEGGLFPHLSVAGNVAFGLPRRQRRDGGRVGELLGLVGLDPALAQRSPHQLSGGQQQRVALARALAPEPSLVLLDEPFSSLDASLREETRQAVVEALSASGATAVLVTHDQAEALSMADEVAVLRAGRLVQLADPRTLYRSPRDLDVATFVGESVVLDADVRDGLAYSALGVLPLDRDCRDGLARVLLRPEQLRLGAPGAGGPTARVRGVDFFGHDARVRLQLPSGPTFSARSEGRDLPSAGDDVSVTVVGAALPFPVTGAVPIPDGVR